MLPLPTLDDKTFARLIEDAKKLIPRFAPEWTDHNLHDPGITILELLAWLTENQQFYLDQIREESYLKYLKLLGITPKPTQSASVDVTFSLSTGYKCSSYVPPGTKICADDIIFETTEPLFLVFTSLVKISGSSADGLVDNTEANGIDGVSYLAFGEKGEVGSRIYLGFDRPFISLSFHQPEGNIVKLTFNLFEDYPVSRGSHGDEQPEIIPSAKLLWEYYSFRDGGSWYPLNVVKDETLMLTQSGRIAFDAPWDMVRRVVTPAVDKKRYWIRATVMESGYEIPPRIDAILLNTIGAIQRNTLSEVIGVSNGLPGQTFTLTQSPVIPQSLILQVKESSGSTENWVTWTQVNDFYASKPDDRHYVLDAQKGEIFFGDGINGAIPQVPFDGAANNIRAHSYQSTLGVEGNVRAGAISTILNPGNSLQEVTVKNMLPATGGASKETLEEASIRARKELKTAYRAVTSEDYEFLSRATPGLRVARAKAIPLFAPESGPNSPASVTVVVVPYSEAAKPVPGKGFLETVSSHLCKHRLITSNIHVIPPGYVKVSVQVVVLLKAGFNPNEMRSNIIEALRLFLHPLKGGGDGQGWPFGKTVFRSELFELIEKVPGVDCVAKIRARGEGDFQEDNDGNIFIQPYSLIYSGDHTVEFTTSGLECRFRGGQR